MEEKYTKKKKYVRAHKKVKALKNFYIHLCIFLIVNIINILLVLIILKDRNENFWIWMASTVLVTWSIVLIIEGWSIFGSHLLFKKSWEDRKIEEFMKEEEQIWE
ncbi:MAG: 2TM domain-containing protein [Bacteroidia bacterium]|nr:2TM domain-containing protein [Bacteroidia bacterium]NND51661.1 2TM domain-containing protein [Flavobacteriaceae bacterium]